MNLRRMRAREKGSLMQNEMCFASEIARRVHARAWLVLFESDEEAQLIDGTKQAVGEKTRGGEKSRARERAGEEKRRIFQLITTVAVTTEPVYSHVRTTGGREKILEEYSHRFFSIVSHTHSLPYRTLQDRPCVYCSCKI